MKKKHKRAEEDNSDVLIKKIENPKLRYFKSVFKRDILNMKTGDAVEHVLCLWSVCSKTPKSFNEKEEVVNFFKEAFKELSIRKEHVTFLKKLEKDLHLVSGYLIKIVLESLWWEPTIPQKGTIRERTLRIRKILKEKQT